MQQINESIYNTRYRTEEREIAIQKLLEYKNMTIVTDGKKIDEYIYTTGALEAIAKEQSIVFIVPNKGLVILVGCVHPTLPVIVEQARKITGNNKIYGIVGGLHYAKLSDQELTINAQYLQSLDLDFIIPSHCTGYKATRMIQKLLGDTVHVSSIGGQFGSGNSVEIFPNLQFNLS